MLLKEGKVGTQEYAIPVHEKYRKYCKRASWLTHKVFNNLKKKLDKIQKCGCMVKENYERLKKRREKRVGDYLDMGNVFKSAEPD